MSTTLTPKKRIRRTTDQIVADLEAELARVKARAEQAKVSRDPSLRHVSGAIRSLEKAAAATQDAVTLKAIDEARATLSAVLGLHGVEVPKGSGAQRSRRSGGSADPEQVLQYIAAHPGARSEEIAQHIGTDAPTLRKAIHGLRDDGKISVAGKARATRYTAV